MPREKKAQGYSPAEFDAVVDLLTSDESVREDIEAITGQKLAGKSPRELFDAFRAVQGATEIYATVIRHGQARQALRETRAAVEGTSTAEEVLGAARARIVELEARNDDLKRQNAALNAARGARPLIRGEVAQ